MFSERFFFFSLMNRTSVSDVKNASDRKNLVHVRRRRGRKNDGIVLMMMAMKMMKMMMLMMMIKRRRRRGGGGGGKLNGKNRDT